MRFKEYLLEDTQEISAFVAEKCKPFLNATNIDADEWYKAPLYRGLDTKSGEKLTLTDNGRPKACLIKTVRTDRIPLDTPKEISRLTDDVFEHIFGWRPRSQGMFCSGSRTQTEDYGKTYQVIPIGELKYIWSPKVADMMTSIKRIASDASYPYLAPEKATSDQAADFYEYMSEFIGERYTNKNLSLAPGRSREVMIKCSKYLAIPV